MQRRSRHAADAKQDEGEDGRVGGWGGIKTKASAFSSHLLVGFEHCGLCGREAVGQQSGEAEQQAEDVQANQDHDLHDIGATSSSAAQMFEMMMTSK